MRKFRCKKASKGSVARLLRGRIGKEGTFYMTYVNNSQWNAKIFKGEVRSASSSYFVIKDNVTGIRYVLFFENLDYATF